MTRSEIIATLKETGRMETMSEGPGELRQGGESTVNTLDSSRLDPLFVVSARQADEG